MGGTLEKQAYFSFMVAALTVIMDKTCDFLIFVLKIKCTWLQSNSRTASEEVLRILRTQRGPAAEAVTQQAETSASPQPASNEPMGPRTLTARLKGMS